MKHLLLRIAMVLILVMLLAATPPAARSAMRQVTSTADAGPGTLRQALLDAAPGDIVTFNTTTFNAASPPTIFVRSPLPPLTKNNLTIDASNAGVVLDGSQAPADTNGLIIRADTCTIRGLMIQKFKSRGIFIEPGASGNIIGGNRTIGAGPNRQGNLIVDNGGSGIEIQGIGADYNIVRGNFIGIGGTGQFAQPNANNGVAIWQGARGNIVGGTTSGFRNVVSGNKHNGVWIGAAGSSQNIVLGNYIGTTSDGEKPVGNSLSGVSIQGGASSNTIGGTAAGAGNLISGNFDNGIYMGDAGTTANKVVGNKIGTNPLGTLIVGQGNHGVVITLGATNNIIGDGSALGRNLISGNAYEGVRIEGPNTAGNKVQGNYISTDISGTEALPNREHGVEIRDYAHDNIIGGRRSLGQGNLLSGDLNHGLVIHLYAHDNTASGNLIGPDVSGRYSLGNHPFGGVDIAEGAYNNMLGGMTPDEGNVVSGNQTDGIALFDTTGAGTNGNKIIHNIVGLSLNGSPLPNDGTGVASLFGAAHTLIYSNTIYFNHGYGVWVGPCAGISIGNTITQNSIYSNTLGGILTSCPLAPPSLTVTAVGATEIVTGKTFPNAKVELFSDDDGQGRVYEGTVQANNTGDFSFDKPGRFAGPNITATSTNAAGDTSAFSQPAHLLWTVLLYLNGNNDLNRAISNTFNTLVDAGPSPRANVLALVDGKSRGDTTLYDITWGQKTKLSGTSVVTSSGERDMGDGQTLVDFVKWARTRYLSRHTMLAIVDHGGGWAPSTEYFGGLPIRKPRFLGGGSGLSWDFSSDYDYLDSPEIRRALDQITTNGANKLDVVFYDVCLMGMLEVAYQIKDDARYFVSSQNIGWAPDGPQGRYVRTIQGIGRTTTPPQMATLLVNSYVESLPSTLVNGIPSTLHPYTISAVDLAALQPLASATNDLARAISETVTMAPAQIINLKNAYLDSQKVDYDADFQIEPATDGFVDLHDFAQHVAQRFAGVARVVTAANTVATRLKAAVVAEQHMSGSPWKFPTRTWNLDHLNGLSIFLPLGEDLEFELKPSQTQATQPTTSTLRLRDTYSSNELRFVRDTAWKGLIDTYYQISASPIPTSTPTGPIDGMLPIDNTAPKTIATVNGSSFTPGKTITVSWAATDTQLDAHGNTIAGSGVVSATVWYRSANGVWAPMLGATRNGPSGTFSFTASTRCINALSVRAVDRIGNHEPIYDGPNQASVFVIPCPTYLPLLRR